MVKETLEKEERDEVLELMDRSKQVVANLDGMTVADGSTVLCMALAFIAFRAHAYEAPPEDFYAVFNDCIRRMTQLWVDVKARMDEELDKTH